MGLAKKKIRIFFVARTGRYDQAFSCGAVQILDRDVLFSCGASNIFNCSLRLIGAVHILDRNGNVLFSCGAGNIFNHFAR